MPPTSPEMDALVAKVAAEDTVIDSAIVAFQSLAAQVANVAGDKAATLALSADIDAKAQALAAAIPQNTPAAAP